MGLSDPVDEEFRRDINAPNGHGLLLSNENCDVAPP